MNEFDHFLWYVFLGLIMSVLAALLRKLTKKRPSSGVQRQIIHHRYSVEPTQFLAQPYLKPTPFYIWWLRIAVFVVPLLVIIIVQAFK